MYNITHDGSMVLLYMVTWIPLTYPLYVSIYTSTMDPMGYVTLCHRCWLHLSSWLKNPGGRLVSKSFFEAMGNVSGEKDAADWLRRKPKIVSGLARRALQLQAPEIFGGSNSFEGIWSTRVFFIFPHLPGEGC